MSLQHLGLTSILTLTLAVGALGCESSSGSTSPASCSKAASDGVRECIGSVSAAWQACYADGGAPCASDDAAIASALSTLEGHVRGSCGDGDFLSLTTDALLGRLRNSCRSEADSVAWRTYGGPQGSVWPTATGADRSCLLAAHEAVSSMVDGSLASIGDCLTGTSCDAGAVDTERAALVSAAVSAVQAACTGTPLEELVAVNPATYVDRAARQVDCVTATSHAETSALTLGCGPSNVDFEPVRGEYIQVVVDGDKWNTICGDGTPYAFQVRLAPEGEPLDRMIVGLQGGGVCAFEADCVPRFENNPELFNALDDEPYEAGIASNDPEVSPFANWTKVYLPYCNQDVFAGGGVTESLGELDLPRHGSLNMRAAVQMVRDVIWKIMDAEEGPGFRPDEVITLFGGWSAGGYGTLYNYHWFLDDLQWPRTSAFPDAGGALDNGQVIGVAGLGLLKIPGWGMLPHLPPYCFVGDCALGPVVYRAFAPRLKQVPEQQMLVVSNPKDDTQRRDAFFTGPEGDEYWGAKWINTMRQEYCDTKDLNGIHYYYTSVSDESLHVVTLRDNLWSGSVDGEVMSDWFWRAVTDADSLESRVEEANFVQDIPGAEPYPCDVAP